jgi:periplasmic protein CpxP/Spy
MKTSRLALALAFALTSLVLASASYAHGDRHGAMRGDPEHMSQRHLDHMAKAADATPEQKTKLAAIAKAAEADIKPLHDQLRANHERVAALYTVPAIDRAAVEQHRAEQSKIMEQISRRQSQARLDSAEVLSPEQRTKLAAMLKKHQDHGEYRLKPQGSSTK